MVTLDISSSQRTPSWYVNSEDGSTQSQALVSYALLEYFFDFGTPRKSTWLCWFICCL